MKPIDFAKALGVAAVVLVLDVALAVGVVYAWSIFVAPGHPRAFYETAGVPVARLSTRVLGTLLILVACWWAARRNRQRNALEFALTVVIAYALLDGASVAFNGFFSYQFGLTVLIKFAGGIAGALLGGTRRAAAD
jgi:hypothetical protein